MNTNVIQIHKNECIHCQVESNLSFRPLVNYLKNRLKTEKTVKSEFYRFLLEKIEKENTLLGNITAQELSKHKETLELIFTILTPLMANENELFWALSTPVPDEIFFSTNAFYQFFKDHDPKNKVNKDNNDPSEVKHLKFIYNLILDRFYSFTSVLKNDIIYAHVNPESKLTQYYNIQNDTQFIDIQYKGTLPELNFELLAQHFQEGNEIEYLVKVLPLKKFTFEGFSVISITDVTLQHAIEGIRNALVDHNYQTEAYNHVIQALKTLSGNGNLEFGLMPFLTVNDKLVFDNQDFSQSMLINSAKASNLEEEVFYSLVDKYKEDPRPIFVSSINEDQMSKDPFLRVLKAAGVCSYSVLPIYYNTQLAGVLEVYSSKEVVVDDKLLSRLRPAMPLIGQLFQYSIEEFDAKMDAVLMDKFTALQPSVQWKFNEAVWHYIQQNNDKKHRQIDTVTFKNMYPLFGAIDIRNSTTERNQALKEDMHVHLLNIIKTLKGLRKFVRLELIDKLIFNCNDWIVRISNVASSNEEMLLNEFLAAEVYPFFSVIKVNHPESAELVDDYFAEILPETGLAYENRRKLEVSMQLINMEVSQYLETAQANLQASYPCYFAKFRTDGVEYDIYIGQDIAPNKPFDLLYLKNIRLWQLTSMVEIARLSKSLIGEMPRPLETTQLVFIHSNSIDISFRNDERRFDVEGAYNIRYEVVKKRIDKVLIKDTSERLTQPNKIAMVYFNADEAKEYIEYIKYLQDLGFLNDDLEQLDLEELQGVSGLKALRVGVKYQTKAKRKETESLKAEDLSLNLNEN